MKRIFLFPSIEEGKAFILTEPKDPVFITGVGMAAMSAAMVKAVRAKKPALAILAGTAGAYDETLPVGEVVEVTAERVPGICDPFATPYNSRPHTHLKAVSANTVCVAGATPAGAQIENTEGAAFFALCEALGVVGCEIRTITHHIGKARSERDATAAIARLTETLTQLRSCFEE